MPAKSVDSGLSTRILTPKPSTTRRKDSPNGDVCEPGNQTSKERKKEDVRYQDQQEGQEEQAYKDHEGGPEKKGQKGEQGSLLSLKAHDALVIDGHHHHRPEEAAFVASLLRGSSLCTRVCQYTPEPHSNNVAWWLRQSWGLVWLACHSTVYNRLGRVSFERLTHGHFYRFATQDDLYTLDTQILVMSSCYSAHLHVDAERFRAPVVIGYTGSLQHDDALVFATRLLTMLRSSVRRNVLTQQNIQDAFTAASKTAESADGHEWLLLKGGV